MYDTAFLDIPALAGASGRVVLPGSKSISNRVLLLAALSRGQCAYALEFSGPNWMNDLRIQAIGDALLQVEFVISIAVKPLLP